MKLKKVKKSSFRYQSWLGLFVFVAGFFSVGLSLLGSTPVFANCSKPLVPITDSCVQDNCNKAGLSSTECRQIINDCENKNVYIGQNASQIGNCSNALRSCYENLVDTSPCKNNGVLSYAASCNNGNVNADGSNKCGFDNAIDYINSDSGGEDFKTNKGIKEDRKNTALNGCDQPGWTIQQVETCRQNIEKTFDACYGDLGGTATKVTADSYKNCMTGKANNPGDCAASGGKWDGSKCTNPQSATLNCDDHGGVSPDDPTRCKDGTALAEAVGPNGPEIKKTDSKCGEARVNIIACGDKPGNEAITNVLKIILRVLTVLVGAAAVGGMAFASIQYARAADESSIVSEAKNLIRNIIIGVVLYGFLIAIVNWLIPGGVFG